MIKINNFQIINNGSQLAIDVETNVGSLITSILLWNDKTFKDESLAISLDYKLEQINNKEVFIVNATEIPISNFTDIYFIEVTSNFVDEDDCSTCTYPGLGIAYNLLPYYICMLNYILENKNSNCSDCNNNYKNDMVITTNLLIDSIEKAIEVGYYSQAIEMLSKLQKICSIKNCKNCKTITCTSCSKFKQY